MVTEDGRYENRYQMLRISTSEQLSKYYLMALLRKLPKDAIITSILNDWGDDYKLRIFSKTFDLVDDAVVIPEMPRITIAYQDLLAEKTIEDALQSAKSMKFSARSPGHVPPKEFLPNNTSQSCICDFEYTGLTSHKYECPVNPRGPKK